MKKTAKKETAVFARIRRLQLRRAAYDYRLTGNPLYAWHGIAMALSADMRLPRALKDYLQRVAKVLGNPKADPGKDIARYVLRSLELNTKGGPSYFAQRKLLAHKHALIERARLLTIHHENDPKEKRAPYKSIKDALVNVGMDPDSITRDLRRKRTKPA